MFLQVSAQLLFYSTTTEHKKALCGQISHCLKKTSKYLGNFTLCVNIDLNLFSSSSEARAYRVMAPPRPADLLGSASQLLTRNP